MTWVLGFALTQAGLLLLALSQAKHGRAVLGGAPPARRRAAFRAAGWGLLLAARAVCVRGFGWFYGLVAATALLNAAGLLLALWLAYRHDLPRPWGGRPA